jgi:tetratricopeptide (TPR) repeat protein
MQGDRFGMINDLAASSHAMELLGDTVKSREPVCTAKRKQRGCSSPPVRHLRGGERTTLQIVVSCLALAGATPVALADAYTDCSQEKDRDREIRGCSEIISKGRETKEDLAKAYNNRGAAYGVMGDYARSIADFRRAIGLSPEDADTYNNRGNVYSMMGDYDRAVADFTEAIRLNPQNANAYNYRGHAYRAKRDYDRAIADFGEVIRLAPHSARAYNNRGAAYGIKGDHDRAIADFTEAIGLSPQNDIAYRNRAKALSAKGDYNGAIADFSAAIRLSPGSADGYNGRAWTYFKAGRAAEGLPDAQKAWELAPNDAQILDTRAHIYEAIGRKEDAVADYGRALSLDPSHEGSRDGLKRLGVKPPPLDECIGPGNQCQGRGQLHRPSPGHWDFHRHIPSHEASAAMATVRVT